MTILPRVLLAALSPAIAIVTLGAQAPAPSAADRALAARVLKAVPLVDGHNDLPWAIRNAKAAPRDVAAYDLRARTPGHTDLARMAAGGLGGQFWSVYVPGEIRDSGYARVQLEQIDIARRVIAMYPERLQFARTAAEVREAFTAGKVGSLLGMEGGHAIENSLGALRAYAALGVRYMTLTHNVHLDWADCAAQPPRLGGLSPFGREVVREMNRLGMLVDLSHVSPGVMSDALDVAEAPVIFSHSGARGVTDHVRNVPDSILARLPRNGGVVMATFVPGFVAPKGRKATLADVADHVAHIRRVAGVDHVGLGGDFDGIDTVVEGLEDVSTYPALLAELARRGWTEAELRKLAGENILRVMRQAEEVATRLQASRPASTATIEQLDRAPGSAK